MLINDPAWKIALRRVRFCVGCQRPLDATGHQIRRLTYEPTRHVLNLCEHRPWQDEPVVGYACSAACGRAWMQGQGDRARLRITVYAVALPSC